MQFEFLKSKIDVIYTQMHGIFYYLFLFSKFVYFGRRKKTLKTKAKIISYILHMRKSMPICTIPEHSRAKEFHYMKNKMG